MGLVLNLLILGYSAFACVYSSLIFTLVIPFYGQIKILEWMDFHCFDIKNSAVFMYFQHFEVTISSRLASPVSVERSSVSLTPFPLQVMSLFFLWLCWRFLLVFAFLPGCIPRGELFVVFMLLDAHGTFRNL